MNENIRIQEIDINIIDNLFNNPRKLSDENKEKLKESIKEDKDFMYRRPLLINKKGDQYICYAGNQRLIACKELNWKKIPCIIDENLDDYIMRKRVIKDNLEYGTWDWNILEEWKEEVKDWNDIPFGEFNWENEEININNSLSDSPQEKKEEEDKESEEQKEIKCPKCGFLFEIKK